jgi:nitrite reductase/ring-hydroxylating ferredoxin subunit
MAENPAQPPPGLRLCELSALGDPGAQGFVFGADGATFRGFVVRRGDRVAGYLDRCPHIGAPLALTPTAYLTGRGDHIICATHGALFRPDDGRCVAGPCVGRPLQPWPVTLEDGWVRTA